MNDLRQREGRVLKRPSRKAEGHLPCPRCGARVTTVIDSRVSGKTVSTVRRNRQCNACLLRWTTYEVSADVIRAIAAAGRHIDAQRRLRLYADALDRIDAAMHELGEMESEE